MARQLASLWLLLAVTACILGLQGNVLAARRQADQDASTDWTTGAQTTTYADERTFDLEADVISVVLPRRKGSYTDAVVNKAGGETWQAEDGPL